MPNITEFYQDRSGNVTIEKDNGTVLNYNASDVVTVQRDGSGNVTGLTADGQVVSSGGGAGITDGDKGDIVVSGAGSTFTIDNEVVSNSKLATTAQATIKGRAVGSGTGTPVDLTPAQARTILNVADGATANTGTVTNVSMSVPTGLTVAGSPVTTSGSLDVTLTAGYSIPTTTKQTEWDNKAAGSHTHAIANVTGLEDALASKLGADQVITATALPDAGIGTDLLIVQRGSAVHTQTRAQVAASVLDQAVDVTDTKLRLVSTDKIHMLNSESLDSPVIQMLGHVRSGVRKWVRTGTYAIFGDSRAGQGFVDETTNTSLYTGQFTARNTYHWLMSLLGHPLRLIQNAGVGGDTLAMAVARMHNTVGGALFGKLPNPGWTAHAPEFLFVPLGINDALNQSSITLNTSIAMARSILDTAHAMGTTVIWEDEPPEAVGGSVMSAAQNTRRLDWNTALKGLELEYPDLWVVPISAALTDGATGKMLAGLTNDSVAIYIHNNNAGAKLRAETILAYTNPLWVGRRSIALTNHASDLITVNPACNQYQVNPLLAGATPTAALQQAVSFASGTTGGVASIITDPEGYGQAIQIDVSYNSSSSAYALLTFQNSQASFRGGERIYGAIRVRCGLPGGSAGQLATGLTPAHMVRTPEHLLYVTDAVADGGVVNNRVALAYAENDAGLRSGFDMTTRTPEVQLKPGAPQLVQQQLYLRGIGAGSGPVRWIISRPTIRAVSPLVDVLS